MSTFTIIVLWIFILSHLLSCRQERLDLDLLVSLKENNSSAVGTWICSFPFYSSELLLKENGLFEFHNQGCMGHGYSEGAWILENGKLVLTSFDQFKQQDESIITSIQSADLPEKSIVIEDEDGEFKIPLDPSVFNTNVHVKWPDTSKIYLDHVSYSLVVDTLFELDRKGFVTDTKFRQKKNNR